jgi:CRP-like cAMP-binding protein
MSSTPENFLLSSLSAESRDFLVSRSSAVELPLRAALYEAERSPKFAYFLTSGIASVVTTMMEGGTAEVVVIGNEGIVGSVHILGNAPVQTRCFIQLNGAGLRVPLAVLREAFRSSEEIRDRILEFVQHQTLCISQIAGCNRLHGAEERLARWLLMVHDRIDSDTLHLTQEFLAEMLGAQRTTVTLVAGILQESGLIEYRRGHVKILNRENLENVACDCYQVTKRLYHGLYRGSREVQHISADGRGPSSPF